MKLSCKFLLSLFLLSFAHLSYATQAPGELQALTVSDTSVEIDWQDVSDVLGYYIYYGETSGSGSDYDIEGVDLIEESNFELTDLNPETRYYIAITAVDDTGSESDKSPELQAITLKAGAEPQAVSLRIVEAAVLDDTSIEMTFSLDMESGSSASRQFIIENIDTGEEIGVDISDVVPGKPQSIIALLDGTLQPSTDYKITVLDIRDVDGNTIESGIDAFVNFETPAVFTNNLDAAGGEDTTQNEEVVEPDSQEISDTEEAVVPDSQELPNTGDELTGNNAGTTVSSEDLSDNTLNAAAENDKLPQTGPEHWLLILVAVMLGTGLFYKLKK